MDTETGSETSKKAINMKKIARLLWNVSDPKTFDVDPLQVRHCSPYFSADSKRFEKLSLPLFLATPNHDLALVTDHPDRPGEIERVASILAGWRVNVAGAAVRRNRSGGRALLITLVDDPIPDGALKALRDLRLKPQQWNLTEPDGLDLTGFPLGSNKKGAAVATTADDKPGEIAEAARVLAACGLNSTGFLVYRTSQGNDEKLTLQVNLLEKNPLDELKADSARYSLLSRFGGGPPYEDWIKPLRAEAKSPQGKTEPGSSNTAVGPGTGDPAIGATARDTPAPDSQE